MALFQKDKMDHTDDDSYELADHTDDDSYELVDHTDGDSYELVDSDDCRTTEDEEDPSTEIKPCRNGTKSPGLEMDDVESEEDCYAEGQTLFSGSELTYLVADDAFDMYGRYHFKTVAYQKVDERVLEFPAHIKRQEDMEIKDAVKYHVLPFLPAKSLKKFRTVSKEWDQWISSPFLAHKQSYCFRDISGFFCQFVDDPTFMTLERSAYGIPNPSLRFLPEAVTIKSSCNGLLLCRGRCGDRVYYICNPTNKEWERLPESGYYHGRKAAIVLAFEPSPLNIEAHYQVICPVIVRDQLIIKFEIYSSQTESWRCSSTDCVELGDSMLNENGLFDLGNSMLKDNGFYMNGVAYWETLSGGLLAFDMKNELCGIQPLPPDCSPHGLLSLMDGELCYIQAHNQARDACIIDIYGGILMSLKHTIAVNLQLVGDVAHHCRVLSCVNSNVLTILTGGVVYSYHMKDQRVEVISRTGNGSGLRYLPYVNSLVSVGCK